RHRGRIVGFSMVQAQAGAFGEGMDVASVSQIAPSPGSEFPSTAPKSLSPKPPWFGAVLYHLIPFRRGVMLENLRRAFGDQLDERQIRRLAQANYAHYVRFLL